MKYVPRNDNVVIRVVTRELLRGIAVPQSSIQGRDYVVVATGPNVEDLEEGDVVFMTGQQKVDWDFLPNSKDLLVIKEANVLLVIEGSE